MYAKGDSLKIGKLNVEVYASKSKHVVLVPVAEPTISTAQLQTYLNDHLGEAGLSIDVTKDSSFSTASINGTTAIAAPDATVFSKYSTQMKELRNAYFDTHDEQNDTYYLFVVSSLQDTVNNQQLDGYMVRGKSIGFIRANADMHTYAHELGHGTGALKHSWTDNGPEKSSTDNLMDYAEGENLTKQQWEGLRDPSTNGGMWDEEEDAEAKNSVARISPSVPVLLQQNGYVYVPVASTPSIYKTPNGYFIDISDYQAVLTYVVLKNGVVAGVFKGTEYYYFSGNSYKGTDQKSSRNDSTYFHVTKTENALFFIKKNNPERVYSRSIMDNKDTVNLLVLDDADISLSSSDIVECNNVEGYIIGMNGEDPLVAGPPDCPETMSGDCPLAGNFQYDNAAACAFRVNKTPISCLEDLSVGVKMNVLSALADGIVLLNPSNSEELYGSINFQQLGINEPGWNANLFFDGGEYDLGIAFEKMMQAGIEQQAVSEHIRGLLGKDDYQLLHVLLADWNLYTVSYPIVQMCSWFANGTASSQRSEEVDVFGKTVHRSQLFNPYVLGFSQYVGNNTAISEDLGCKFTGNSPRMQFTGGVIHTSSTFIETYSVSISKTAFIADGGTAVSQAFYPDPFYLLGTGSITGVPMTFSLNGQVFNGREYPDRYEIDVPRTYSYAGMDLDPLEQLMFIFPENHNKLGIEAGKPYFMPVVWGLCMEKLIYDEQEELASREINNKLILFASSVTAPFMLGSSLELGILLTTAGTAYFDSRFQSVQQTEGLKEYQSQESFRNAWNMVYNTVQIADMVIGVAGTAYTLNELYKLYREMRYMESASKLVKNDFVLLLRGSEGAVSQAGRFIANSGTELRTYLDDLVTLPLGKTYSGKFYKSVSKNAELTHNAKPDIISEYSIEEAWGRYDLQGESGMYYSQTLSGNQTEMSVYGDWNSYSTYEFNNVQINNMLDLTDPSVIEQLGTEFNKLVLTTGTKPEMYEFTNVIGTWARSKGYKGLIVSGARGSQDYTNIVIFSQSDLTITLSGITPIKLK